MVTFKIEEGQQYRVASVDFQTSIGTLDAKSLRSFSRVNVGSLYNAEALEKSVEEMQIEASRRGYAFAIVRPRGDRNFEQHTVSIVFSVDEGPRTYIERINVRGNTRTRDYVIRREFDLSEGDAYNRALVDRAERRLKNLDFFKTVKIADRAGLVERSRDPDRRSRREIDRRLLGVGRLFDHGRCARRSQHFRAQLPRPRPVCKGGGDLWPVRARLFAVVRRALSAGLSRRARPRPVPARAAGQQLYFLRHQDAGLQPAARLQPAGRSRAAAALFDLSAGDLAAEHAGELQQQSSNSLLAFNPSPAFANLVGATAGGSITSGGPSPTPPASACGATAMAKPRCRSARSCRAARR